MNDPKPTTSPMANNTVPPNGIPVVIEHPDTFTFAPGERERDWHVASGEEYARYVDYWEAKED